jgi:hypothetical protein
MVVKLAGHAPAGAQLPVTVPPEHLHVFDSASGVRLEPSGTENPPVRLAAAQSAD